MEDLIKKILCKENIKCRDLKKSPSGFTNLVYFVNDEPVVKIINRQTKPEKLEKEIDFYKTSNLTSYPNIFQAGK